MRPTHIKISGFGPYSGTTEIDFTQLGSNGLYLVAGETGAGKTTIFDAIAYALYGEPSGENRKVSMLRSMYASLDTPTEVELTFCCNGKEYRIRRNPEYERTKLNGKGTTLEKPKQELYCPGKAPITKADEVRAAIQEIIGIDRKQFFQIAMIAQGEFRKVLKAGTEERSVIFRNVFKTERFLQLQEELKKAYKEVDDNYSDAKKSIDQYVDGVRVADGSRLQVSPQIQETIDAIRQIVDEDVRQLRELGEKRESVEEQLQSANRELEAAKTLDRDRKELKKAKGKLDEAKQKEKELRNALEAAKEKEPEIEEIAGKITTIENQLLKYTQLDDLQSSIRNLQRLNEEDSSALTTLQATLSVAEGNLAAMKEEQEELSLAGEEMAWLEGEKKEKDKRRGELTELSGDLKELEDLGKKTQRAQNQYRADYDAFEEAKRVYDRKHKAYLDEQAGILAEELEEGRPCPVCGSMHHPAPAVKAEEAPTKAQLDASKQAMDEVEETASMSGKEAGKLAGALQEKSSQILESVQALLGHQDLQQVASEIQEEIAELNYAISELEKKIKDEGKKASRSKELKEKLIPDQEKACQTATDQIQEINDRLNSNKTKLEEREQQLTALQKELSYASKEQAKAAIEKLQEQRGALQSAIDKAQSALRNIEVACNTISGQISQLKSQLEGKPELDLVDLEARVNALDQKKRRLEGEEKILYSRYTTNKKALDNISHKAEELKELTAKLKWIGTLDQTANGTLKGKEKIKLEAYIQMTYFEQVLARANQRLRIMSGGQYELVRKENAADARSQAGLDIDVKDYYNGTIRDAGSLSGGESFMASLALALGMSDEAQASAGGVQIDTLFVDEGFGSLDEETLQQAMKALISLAQDNRLVGIISHVAELKERIDKQIIVTKDKSNGSHVQIIT